MEGREELWQILCRCALGVQMDNRSWHPGPGAKIYPTECPGRCKWTSGCFPANPLPPSPPWRSAPEQCRRSDLPRPPKKAWFEGSVPALPASKADKAASRQHRGSRSQGLSPVTRDCMPGLSCCAVRGRALQRGAAAAAETTARAPRRSYRAARGGGGREAERRQHTILAQL